MIIDLNHGRGMVDFYNFYMVAEREFVREKKRQADTFLSVAVCPCFPLVALLFQSLFSRRNFGLLFLCGIVSPLAAFSAAK